MCRILACSDKHSVLTKRYLYIGSQHIRRRALGWQRSQWMDQPPMMVEAAPARYAMHTKSTEVATGKVSKAVEPLATSCRSLCASARNCCALPTGVVQVAPGLEALSR